MAAAGIIKELQFFGLAVLRGILIVILYDLLRILRRVFSHGVWAVAIEDLCYWLAAAFLVTMPFSRSARKYAMGGKSMASSVSRQS